VLLVAEANEGRYNRARIPSVPARQQLDGAVVRRVGSADNGSATVIVENINASPDRLHRQYSVANNGTLVYQQKAGVLARQLTMYGVDGTRIGEIGDPAPFPGEVFISPEGRRAAVLVSDAAGRSGVWIYDLATGVPTRLAFGSMQPGEVAWGARWEEPGV
jgi:hypothetical protein